MGWMCCPPCSAVVDDVPFPYDYLSQYGVLFKYSTDPHNLGRKLKYDPCSYPGWVPLLEYRVTLWMVAHPEHPPKKHQQCNHVVV